MKIKVVGFKVGQSRPTANRTVSVKEPSVKVPFGYPISDADKENLVKGIARLGKSVYLTLAKSDFISIRRVDD